MLGRVLVTGASGWIGTALCQSLASSGVKVVGVARSAPERAITPGLQWVSFGTDFEQIGEKWPEDVESVVHLAARVHHMGETNVNALRMYEATNHQATLRLAQVAKYYGVRNFIFVSSIKAIAEEDHGLALSEADLAAPLDPYGISKRNAEVSLMAMSSARFAPTILRIPLVYGPGVKANMARLIKAVRNGVPLPLGKAAAPRSLLGLDNLLDAITTCLSDSRARGELFHVADREVLSVSELIRVIGTACGRSARLVPVPLSCLRWAALLLGKKEEIDRLTKPLRVDTSKLQRKLGWTAPHDVLQGLQRACGPTR